MSSLRSIEALESKVGVEVASWLNAEQFPHVRGEGIRNFLELVPYR